MTSTRLERNSGWVAILEGITIAGGTTRDEVERILQNIVPPEKKKFCIYLSIESKMEVFNHAVPPPQRLFGQEVIPRVLLGELT